MPTLRGTLDPLVLKGVSWSPSDYLRIEAGRLVNHLGAVVSILSAKASKSRR